MRRRTILNRPLAVLAVLAALGAFGSACSAEHEEQSSSAGAGAFSDRYPTEAEAGEVFSVIEKERERLRNVQGRTGILAEERRYSLFDEELIIRDFFQDRRGGFFLDIGCAWPVRSSNTYYLEEHLGWHGIAIDALAEYGPGWRKKRPNSRFFSYLVTDRSGIQQTFFKSPNPGLSSTDRERASGGTFGDRLEPEEVRIDTITLNDLLDREGVSKIDLLSMDIEGHELKALAGFDIERFQPELVVIEGQVMGKREAEIHSYLERHGYELIEKYLPFDSVNSYFTPKGRVTAPPAEPGA